MHDILVVLVHSIVTVVRLIRPGGLRAVVAESALTRVAVGMPVTWHPRTDPHERHYRMKCARAHFMRYVVAKFMWRPANNSFRMNGRPMAMAT